MDYKIQILSLIYSFGYGVFFYFLSILNDKILIKNRVLSVVLLLLFVFINALLYITILYKINFGIFHIYFLIMLALGYYFVFFLKKLLIKNIKWDKLKRKNIKQSL